jgi:hypothetical protein
MVMSHSLTSDKAAFEIVQFLAREVVVANKPWFATLMQPERTKDQKTDSHRKTLRALASFRHKNARRLYHLA